VAYDEDLADRIRPLIGGEPGLSEKRMFGGLAFLVNGNMAVASSDRGIMVRVDPDETPALVEEPNASRMVMRGREMNGWLRIEHAGVDDDSTLETWVRRGVAYARSLPSK
jgi:TfoX/Sxy family transcriptional regulator of competence genes